MHLYNFLLKIVHIHAHESLYGLAQLIISKIVQKIVIAKNFFLYGPPSLYVRGRTIIRGSKHLHRKGSIHIFGNAWLEAVYEYKGKKYEPRVELGANLLCSGSLHISCIKYISIGNNVLIGTNVYIGDHLHGYYGHDQQIPASHPNEPPHERILFSKGDVVIGSNVWIGNNVVILSPSYISSGCIIGANSVVVGNFPSNSIIAGSPARIIKSFNTDSQSWI